MSSYESFASVYDMFMDNIPYREWCRYLIGLLQEYGVQDGLVLELGCGTGKATRLLSRAGYDMIGIDNSPDMLEIALEKEGKIKEDKIGRASCRERGLRLCRSRWSPYH